MLPEFILGHASLAGLLLDQDLRYQVFECLLAQDGCATRALQFSGSTVDASQVQLSYLAALNGAFAKVQPARVIAEGL